MGLGTTDWLAELLGPNIYSAGTLVQPNSSSLNFIGPTIAYNPVTKRIDITAVSGGGSTLVVANIASLGAVDDALLDDGAIAAMASIRDMWWLDKTSALGADGITVINTLSGAGKWVRACQSNARWRAQPTWHINQAVGSDENSGLTAGMPLASHEEFQRRVADADQPIEIAMVVTFAANYVGDIENRIPVSQLAPYGSISYEGTRTVLFSGSFTAVTAWAAPGTVGTMTDAALPASWAASGGLERLCVLTSGPNAGAASWVMVEPVAKTARYNGFFDETTFATHDPAPAETYDAVQLTQLTGKISQDAPGWIQFKNLHINPPLGFDRGIQITSGFASFTFCHLEMNSPYFAGPSLFGASVNGCNVECLSTSLRAFNAQLFLWSNWIRGSVVAGNGSYIDMLSRNVAQFTGPATSEIGAEADGTFRVGPSGEWVVVDQVSAASRPVRCETHGNVIIRGIVWGIGNVVDYVVEVDSGGMLIYAIPAASRFALAAPTVADVLVGSVPTLIAGLPVVDLSKGAFAVEE